MATIDHAYLPGISFLDTRSIGTSLTDVSEVTKVLEAAQRGDRKAAEELLPLVYDELRRLAGHKMASEPQGQTLQPTALVHEAWLRLTRDQNAAWDGRAHFFAAAAESMRRILVENARRKQAVRHGGGKQRLDIHELEVASPAANDQLLAVNEALDKLTAQNPRQAELVKLRYFVGMTNEEAAQAMGISLRSAKYYWTHARAWLYQEIKDGNLPESS